jgi:hypothetical protein
MSKRREIDKAIAHLMQWAERPEWADEMNTIFDRNTVDAADSLGMEVNEVLEVLDEHDLMHMIIGFCAEDLAPIDFHLMAET